MTHYQFHMGIQITFIMFISGIVLFKTLPVSSQRGYVQYSGVENYQNEKKFEGRNKRLLTSYNLPGIAK